MKRRVLLVALAFASAGAFAAHVVPVLTAEQKAFLALSAAERRAVFTNAAYRTKLADSVRKMDWREPADGETSRWRRLPGIPNMRDIGGLKGLDGRTVACGRIFRSGGFNDNAKSELVDDADHPGEKKRVWKGRGKDRLTDDARKFQIENFGIRTDLDLRTDGECNEMTASPLGPQVAWVHSPSQSYGSFFSDVGRASTKRNFALFLDERNYPIAVHCIAGADRTGSLIYLLEALLGVSDDDLLLDWELTAFYSSTVNFAHAPRYDKLVAGFAKLPGRTTRERAESYVRSLGFTDEDIARFRKIMLSPSSAGTCSGPIRAVQLDLARQKESPAFVTNYMSRVRAAGYNTIVLYLEDRVKTPSYPYPADADSYSLEEMAGIVRHGVAIGLDVVPVISPLGHTERFLAHKELAKFGEQCEGVGRWGKTDNPGCFCLENPEARAWMERYISEVVAVFPGRNLHLGFDETWNLGYCTRCRPLVEKEGLAAVYMRSVNWAHGLAKKLGKRMWMWDDFFEYFDPKVLEEVPRDILMCQWNYDRNIERTGPRSHFGGRLRRNILATYERLGFECVVCPWFDYENVRTFTEYAQSHKVAGFFFTQWELETDFHSIFFPRVLAAADLWSGRGTVVDGDWITRPLKACFPTLKDEALRMLEGLMFDQSKLKFTTVTKENILNGTHENAKLRYWRTALNCLRRHPSHPGTGDVPADPFSEAAFLEDIVVRTEMAILCAEVRNAGRYLLWPDRTERDASSAKDRLLEIRALWRELVARRESQWAVWRPGITSKKEQAYRTHLPKLIEELVAQPSVAKDDEWLFEVDLAMIDTHGCPQCTAEVLVNGEWKTVAEGVWKPLVTDGPYSAKHYPVRIPDGVPTALRLTARGYGDCGLCHVSLRNRSRRFVPSKIVETEGRVQDAENLLIDDFRGMRFGLPDCNAAFLDQKLARRDSVVRCELKEDR